MKLATNIKNTSLAPIHPALDFVDDVAYVTVLVADASDNILPVVITSTGQIFNEEDWYSEVRRLGLNPRVKNLSVEEARRDKSTTFDGILYQFARYLVKDGDKRLTEKQIYEIFLKGDAPDNTPEWMIEEKVIPDWEKELGLTLSVAKLKKWLPNAHMLAENLKRKDLVPRKKDPNRTKHGNPYNISKENIDSLAAIHLNPIDEEGIEEKQEEKEEVKRSWDDLTFDECEEEKTQEDIIPETEETPDVEWDDNLPNKNTRFDAPTPIQEAKAHKQEVPNNITELPKKQKKRKGKMTQEEATKEQEKIARAFKEHFRKGTLSTQIEDRKSPTSPAKSELKYCVYCLECANPTDDNKCPSCGETLDCPF
jgi:hypothetical protein